MVQRQTYRERRAAQAERLFDWGEKRQQDAGPMYEAARERMNMIPLGEPIHSSTDRRRREKMVAAVERSFEHGAKGDQMVDRAAGIEHQLATSIYDDDPDAIERLRVKLERLEAEREHAKQANAAFRREHRAELKGMTAYERDMAQPFRSYIGQNLSGNISRLRDRLRRLESEREHGPTDRLITARFDSECELCGSALVKGSMIRYNRQQGARCVDCGEER